jgi:hypothetical protein
MGKKPGFSSDLLAAKVREGAGRTDLSNYIRAHFDKMRAVLPERSIPWPAVRAYLIEQGVIDERTTSTIVKRTWHREKRRRAKLPPLPARSSAPLAPGLNNQVEQPSSPPSQAADEDDPPPKYTFRPGGPKR